ncbi:MAG: type III-B CRISPR module RAMP protein Cmr4 [Paludibacteraceae bacterium]|nr:type III-B CRISPR module RAMP protein Cmr4 [Paludibacteraceae bacterium]
MNSPEKYLGKTLDPVHIGAGGYRLGRVDNTIVREPATDVPKIPGTSLAGVIRAYAEIVKAEDDKNEKKFNKIKIEETFGSENKQGMVRVYDGQIVFFPVSSSEGTVWITTKELLEYWLSEIKDTNGEAIKIPPEIKDEAYAIKGISCNSINLGWLLVKVQNIENDKTVVLPAELINFLTRIVVVSDKLFSHLVNDNLEVRTSVRIDPKTGTAAETALFTYEAIPRGTVIAFETIVDSRKDNENSNVYSLIEATFPYIKLLGVGGMGTRGFGRVDFFTAETQNNQTNNNQNGGQ